MSVKVSQRRNNSYRRGVRRVLLATLCLNISVVIGKLTAGLLAGSLSVIGDAIHSAGDSINNIVGLIVIKYATAEPNERYPYGHAKCETLAAFTIAGFLFVTCYEISASALKRLMSSDPGQPKITALTFAIMIATIIVNLVVTIYEHRRGKQLGSVFLIADAVHTRSDVFVSCSVLIGLLLVHRGYTWLDPVVSFGVAALIGWNCIRIFKATVPVLVDAAPVAPARIAEIAESVPSTSADLDPALSDM